MRVLSTLDREQLKPNASVALHRHSHCVCLCCSAALLLLLQARPLTPLLDVLCWTARWWKYCRQRPTLASK